MFDPHVDDESEVEAQSMGDMDISGGSKTFGRDNRAKNF